MINALRFRGSAAEEWRLVRFPSGTGRFVRYQGLSGPAALLRLSSAALRYALTGVAAPGVSEASVHLADDAGHLWIIDRKPGGMRILRNGEPVPGDGERALAQALLDGEASTGPELKAYRIEAQGGRLTRVDADGEGASFVSLRELITRQMKDLAVECAKELGLGELADPKALVRLTREAEPLHAQYREIARQYKALTPETKDDAALDVGVVERLEAELTLIDEIAKAAEPLLTPGVTLKGLKDELDTAETRLTRARETLGLPLSGDLPAPDFRAPIELLCRLEAQARLIRAAQGARKFCEQRIEPLHRQYLDVTEAGVVADRQIGAELESCLASLTLQLGRPAQGAGTVPAQRGWFERFKLRASETAPRDGGGPRVSDDDLEPPQAGELETARMAIEFALARLAELEDSLRLARDRKATAVAELDFAHEELVKSYGRLREGWQTLARERGLPEDLTLERLIGIVAGFGEIARLEDARAKASARLRAYQAALSAVERLVLEWRQKTASQKASGLSTPPLLIAEARDIIRYREPKQKRIASLKARAAERLAEDTLRSMLRTRRQDLLTQWRSLFDERSVKAPPPIHHEALPLTFKRSAVIRALALLQGSASDEPGPRVFESTAPGSLATVYLWDGPELDNRLRLAFLEELEAASAGRLRLLFVADVTLGQMLAGLGVGMGHDAPPPKAATPPRRAEPGLTLPRVTTPAVKAPAAGGGQDPQMLNEKAMRALAVLTGRRG
jgi:hypothetical protein